MFHVELRQFPHQGRAFNLGREELEERILAPWTRGELVEVQERRWAPERAKLTIYEGRGIETVEIGLGRGWANVTRTGTDVTEKLLAAARGRATEPPQLQELKQALLARAGSAPLTMTDVMEAAADLSETPPRAQAAMLQLLDEGRLALVAARHN